MWNSNLIIFGSFMHLHVYVKRPEVFIGIGRYIKRLIIIIINNTPMPLQERTYKLILMVYTQTETEIKLPPPTKLDGGNVSCVSQ